MNEGFADYVSYEGVNKVRPKWKVWERFVRDEVQDVLAMDSLNSTHPISGNQNFLLELPRTLEFRVFNDCI